jgi:chromosome segregation ATPase
MEGIVEHFRSERDDLRLKLQRVEEQLAQANSQVLRLNGEVESLKGSKDLLVREIDSVKKMASNWEMDNERLRADLKVQREDNQLLRGKVTGLEQRLLVAVCAVYWSPFSR